VIELVMFRFHHGDVPLSILSINGGLWGWGEHLRIGAYAPSTEMVCFINNTRGLQQGERAQVVVSGVIASDMLGCGLLSARKPSGANRINDERNCEEGMGKMTKTEEYNAGGRGRFVPTKGNTNLVHLVGSGNVDIDYEGGG